MIIHFSSLRNLQRKSVCPRRPVTNHHRQTPCNTTPACEGGRKRRENPPPGIQQTVATAKLTRYAHIRVSQATPRQSNTNALNKNGASVTLIPRSTLQGSANSKPSASSQILRIHQFAIVRFLTENPGPDREGENDGSGAIIQGRITYLTFLMAMMKKQPMMARAMAVGKAKL